MKTLIPWTKEQDDIIREYRDLPLSQLAKLTGHTEQSTKTRRYQLCGARDRPTMVRSSDEDYMRRLRNEAS